MATLRIAFAAPAATGCLSIERLVALYHLLYRKTLLDPVATAGAIQGCDPMSHLDHLVLIFDQIAGLGIF